MSLQLCGVEPEAYIVFCHSATVKCDNVQKPLGNLTATSRYTIQDNCALTSMCWLHPSGNDMKVWKKAEEGRSNIPFFFSDMVIKQFIQISHGD